MMKMCIDRDLKEATVWCRTKEKPDGLCFLFPVVAFSLDDILDGKFVLKENSTEIGQSVDLKNTASETDVTENGMEI